MKSVGKIAYQSKRSRKLLSVYLDAETKKFHATLPDGEKVARDSYDALVRAVRYAGWGAPRENVVWERWIAIPSEGLVSPLLENAPAAGIIWVGSGKEKVYAHRGPRIVYKTDDTSFVVSSAEALAACLGADRGDAANALLATEHTPAALVATDGRYGSYASMLDLRAEYLQNRQLVLLPFTTEMWDALAESAHAAHAENVAYAQQLLRTAESGDTGGLLSYLAIKGALGRVSPG